MGTSLSLASGNPSFDGSVAETINASVPTLTGGNGIDITGTTVTTDNDGTTINNSGGSGAQNQVLKVPQSLTINATTFDGSVARNFTLATSDTTYTGGKNITVNTTPNPDEIDLDPSITDMTNISFLDNGSATSIIGSNYPSSLTTATYLDLSSTTNKILPPDVFDVGSGIYRMTIGMNVWRPNDDNSYYNLAVEDDSGAKTHGSVRPMTSSLEMCGFIPIPNGWTATKLLIDVRDSGGATTSLLWTAYNVYTYGSTGFTTLQSGFTNSETSLGTPMTGTSDTTLMVKLVTTSTANYVRGGYLVLTKN